MDDKYLQKTPVPKKSDPMFEYVVMLRKSIGESFEKLSQDIQVSLAKFTSEQVTKALNAQEKNITIQIPDAFLRSLEATVGKIGKDIQGIEIPREIHLTDADVEKIRGKALVVPDSFSIQDESIEKIATEIKKALPETPGAVDYLVPLMKKMKKNPDLWFNVRLTDGKEFYAALREMLIAGGHGGGGVAKSSFVDTEGKPTSVKVNPDGTIPTTADVTIEGVATETTVSGIAIITEWLRQNRFDAALSTLASQTTASGIQTVLEDIRSNKFNVQLSSRASEATLQTIATQVTASGIQTVLEAIRTLKFDVALSTRASEATLQTIATQVTVSGIQQILEAIRTTKFDVNLSTRASETTLQTLGTQVTASGIQQVLQLIQISLNTLDDWDESDRAKVNLILGQAGVTGGAGNSDAATQRVVIASDQADVDVAPQAKASGGATPYKLISAATTNATSLKATPGQVYSVQVYNINAAARYLKFYNKASAPTVGSDTPVKVIVIPGATTGAGSNFNVSVGVEFTAGIAFALTTGIADSDTGAVAANEIVVNIDYK